MFIFYRPEGEGNAPLVFPTDWLLSQSAHICLCSGGSKWGGGAREGRAPPGPNSFNFMQFIGKISQNRMLAHPGGLASPPHLWEILDPPLLC